MRISTGVIVLLAVGLAGLPAAAQNAAFQQFLLNVCTAGQAGDLENRCQTPADAGANRGQVAGDSQDSLNPTQSLGNVANALAETRARLKALEEHMGARRDEMRDAPAAPPAGRAATESFDMTGWSLLVQGRGAWTERTPSSRERGFEADSAGLQVGADYRVTDHWLVGALVGYDRRQSAFDQDAPGSLFTPPSNDGDSDGDSYSLSLFTTRNFGEHWYADGIATVTRSSYRFRRQAVFLQSNRAFQPQLAVNTAGDTDGYQYALGLGAGYQGNLGAFGYNAYARLDHEYAQIDGYTESGGNGLAMRFAETSNRQTLATAGLGLSYAISTGFGVVLPQLFGEYVNGLDVAASTSRSSYVADGSGANLTVTGDEPDGDYGRLGASVVLVLPNGWMPFLAYDQDVGRAYVDERRLAGGLRLEF